MVSLLTGAYFVTLILNFFFTLIFEVLSIDFVYFSLLKLEDFKTWRAL